MGHLWRNSHFHRFSIRTHCRHLKTRLHLFPRLLLSPDLPRPQKEADKDRTSSPTAPMKQFPNPAHLSWKWLESEEGKGGNSGVSAPGRWLLPRSSSEQKEPSTLFCGIKYLGTSDQWEFFHHSLSKQQKGSCKSHWKCLTACSYRHNLVLGIQLKENSIRGYVLHEWTQFGSEE